MSHVTHMNESWHTWKRVVSHFEWVLSHRWSVQSFKSIDLSDASTMPPQATCAMTHPWLYTCELTQSSAPCESFLLNEPYILTHSHKFYEKSPQFYPKSPTFWQKSLKFYEKSSQFYQKSPIFHLAPSRYVCHGSSIISCVWYDPSMILYVSHEWFLCVTWLLHLCDMTLPYVWHTLAPTRHVCRDSSMTPYVWYDSFVSAVWILSTQRAPHSAKTSLNSTKRARCSSKNLYPILHMKYPSRNGTTSTTAPYKTLPKEPCNLRKEPHSLPQEPYVLHKEPHIQTKEPRNQWKEPYIIPKEPSEGPILFSTKEALYYVERALHCNRRTLLFAKYEKRPVF